MTARSPSQAAFVGRLLALLPRLGREMAQADRLLFAHGALTLPQLWTLEYLRDDPACTMRRLAAQLRLTGSTTTGLVDQLAVRGLALRRRGQADRRVVTVALTARGRRVMDNIRRHKRQTLLRWFRRFSAAERAAFLDSMEKLHGGLAGHPAPAGGKEPA